MFNVLNLMKGRMWVIKLCTQVYYSFYYYACLNSYKIATPSGQYSVIRGWTASGSTVVLFNFFSGYYIYWDYDLKYFPCILILLFARLSFMILTDYIWSKRACFAYRGVRSTNNFLIRLIKLEVNRVTNIIFMYVTSSMVMWFNI